MLGPSNVPVRPPTSRRAISTGAICLPSASGGDSSLGGKVSPEPSQWNPGMPLPPPPPGPPPASRSHSLNRVSHQGLNNTPSATDLTPNDGRPRPSRRVSHVSTLGAVPPTPAGWFEDDPIPNIQASTTIRNSPCNMVRDDENVQSRSTTLARRPARREPSADSILERRSKSKARRDVIDPTPVAQSEPQTVPQMSTFPKPANLVLSTANGLLQRRLAERTDRAEDGVVEVINRMSPETARRHGQRRTSSALTPPYTPGPDPHRQSLKRPAANNPATVPGNTSADSFVQASLERFHMFIQQEASSPSDRDRLKLFTSFMVQESRVRRDRYSSAFNSMAGDILDLTRDMWRPCSSADAVPENTPVRAGITGESPRPMTTLETSRESADTAGTSSCSSAVDFTPATDTDSLYDSSERADDKPPSTPWGERYHPSLSPIKSIPSMAVSTVPDEEDSRGRSASRWWEGSAEGSGGKGGRKIEMTKQETKYMSLHPSELLLGPEPSPSYSTPTPNTVTTAFRYGADEYPPEKTDWREESPPAAGPPQSYADSPHPLLGSRGKQPMVPALDISRLVTLPPPYPRHYPALQNNHPSLSEIRNRHRQVAETVTARQTKLYTDYCWDPTVYVDLSQTCEISIIELEQRLDGMAGEQQTEGDERPELLEQLTLLKWIFEAREQLQKQDFDATIQRVKTRSQALIDHFHAVGDYERLMDEEQRMKQQGQEHQLSFAEQSTSRFSQLLEMVECHVSRGVEMQLSAFWDIAPGLLEVMQRVPHDLDGSGFSVHIPQAEYQDNPTYRRFPLQYLLHTLDHAKKSAYQFIESQTNLLCLLHEVRTAAMSAEMRFVEMRRVVEGEDVERLRAEMSEVRKGREEEETAVLRERIGVLEGQWELALGEEVNGVLERVRRHLSGSGGWDDGMDE